MTFSLHSSKSISFILIPTNSERRIPQFKNKVVIAKSLWQFLLSSSEAASNSFLLSSKDRYFGKRLSFLGVFKFKAGLFFNRNCELASWHR